MALAGAWQQAAVRETALERELAQLREALRVSLERHTAVTQSFNEAQTLMLQQRELAKQAYQQGYEDAQSDFQEELATAQQAVERATESQRTLRARLANREERCAELERAQKSLSGARHHWVL